jgi:mevalonate kinase
LTFSASACGKAILLGEHAVVYGQPALAIPVAGLEAYAELLPADAGFYLEAPDIGLESPLEALPPDHPLAFCVRSAVAHLGIPLPAARLRIRSAIPVAAGLGSGAAVSIAVIRVLAASAGRVLPAAEISSLAFEVEKILHGTPSGVDNTVIAYAQPVFFVKGGEPDLIRPGADFHWIVANSGIRGETKAAVAGVRERHDRDPFRYDRLFREIGGLTNRGRTALLRGDGPGLGQAMNECHAFLAEMGVSLPILDHMAESARTAGALGAKLSGAGAGGNVLTLADAAGCGSIRKALQTAGSCWDYAFTLPAG